MKKVLIAPDKFKDSLSAIEVCKAIAQGLQQKDKSLDITFHPMADGGDGSLSILTNHIELKSEIVKTQDPLGRPINANYYTSTDSAFIEVCSASGLVLLKDSERNPLYSSTLGTGKMMVDALTKGFKNIYLFLGGSATNDAGIGIAQALGFEFFDAKGQILEPIGENLSKIASIKDNQLFDFKTIKIVLFYDVINPLFGKQGAAYVYAPQKGANEQQLQMLDLGLMHFSNIIQHHKGIDISKLAGGGAAGGIGASLVALCGAEMEKGFDALSKLTNLEEKVEQTDWVISGEGKLDEQSLQGKVIDGIAALCKKHKKPLSLFVGKNELTEQMIKPLNIHSVFSISSMAMNNEDAMSNAGSYLTNLAKGATQLPSSTCSSIC